MLVVVSDTHRREGHGLRGRTLEAVREADAVVHAGDFTSDAVFDAFRERAAAADRVDAVYGNNDDATLRDRLPGRLTLEAEGLRLVVVHGHEHDATALGLLARQEDADLVVVGHSHRPGVERLGDVTVVNPGSHAQPRWYRPAHAELERDDDGRVAGRLVEPDGTVFERFEVEPSAGA